VVPLQQKKRQGDTRPLRVRAYGARLVSAFMPVALHRAPPDVQRRGRILVVALLAHLALSVLTLGTVLFALPVESVRTTAAVLLGSMLILLGLPIALTRLRIVLATNLLLASAFTLVLTGFVLIGGMQVPLLHWCALFPMLAVLMGTPRSAFGWAGLSLLAVSASAWLGSGDPGLPNHFAADGVLRAARQLVDATIWIAVWALFALVYERQRADGAAELGAANADPRREVAGTHGPRERARRLSYQDALTRLPMRELFREQLAEAMRAAEVEGRQVGVLFLDLDGFKEINDVHGHDMGDLLLQHVARRLSNCVRAADAVSRGRDGAEGDGLDSRHAGDEFIVLLASIRGHEEAAVVARRIHGALRRPVDLHGHEVSISASVGIAMYPNDEEDLDSLLRKADLAMYHAKERGKNNFQFFDESLNDAAQRRAALAGDLRVALERGELYLVYQPIIDAGTREFISMEALLRWRHPVRGELLPGEFIDVAEEFGLMTGVGDFVLEQSCRQWRVWRDIGLPSLRLSINVSGAQLKQRDFEARVGAVLRECSMPAKSLELEITENAMMEDEEGVSRSLDAIKVFGVRVALDDFGTGYSSLSYVKRFPVDTIKIDQSFVAGVTEDPEARAITSAIVALAHELDLTVTAEGVETEEQDGYLSSLRCDALQGYLFSRPLVPEELETFLREIGQDPGGEPL
jgi:diguanylate cyclase (GGDEF)-like protein